MSGIYSLLSAAKAQQRRLDATSNNLANVNTSGFKGDRAVFKEHLNRVIGQDLESEEDLFAHDQFLSPFSSGGSSKVIADEMVPDMSVGSLKRTGNQFDMALGEKGFFSVETPNGTRYTRNGQFRLDKNGFITTLSGDPLLGVKGPIKIEGKDVLVGSDGGILVDGKELDVLNIVTFIEEPKLLKQGNSYWAPVDKNQTPIPFDDATIHQGFIENSNVDAVKEMVKLISINREFDASQKALRAIDELDEKSISLSRI